MKGAGRFVFLLVCLILLWTPTLADDKIAGFEDIEKEVEAAYQDALKAIKDCDKEAFDAAMKRLGDLRAKTIERLNEQKTPQDAPPATTTTTDEEFDWKTLTGLPRWMRMHRPVKSRDDLRNELALSFDLAKAAERLAFGQKSLIYSQVEGGEIYELARQIFPGQTEEEVLKRIALYNQMQKRVFTFGTGQDRRYATTVNCYEFVHLAAWVVGECEHPEKSGNSINEVIKDGTLQEWDFQSEIPRGKVIIGTMPKAQGGQGKDGTYHFAISLGNGRVANIRSNGDVVVQDVSTTVGGAFPYMMYWWYGGKVFFGDYDYHDCGNDQILDVIRTNDEVCGEGATATVAPLLDDIVSKIGELLKLWENCDRPTTGTVTGSRNVTIFFDRGDCRFGGGTTTVTIGGPTTTAGPIPIPTPTPGTTPKPPPTTPEDQPEPTPEDQPTATSTPSPAPTPVPAPPVTGGPDETPTPPTSTPSDSPGDRPPVPTPTPDQTPPGTTPGGSGIPVPVPVPVPGEDKPPDEEQKPPPGETPPSVPSKPDITIVIYVKANEKVLKGNTTTTQAFQGAQIKLPGFVPPLPIAGAKKDEETGHDSDPNYGVTTPDGVAFSMPVTNDSPPILPTSATTKPSGPVIGDLPSGGTSTKKDVTIDLSPNGGTIVGIVIDPAKEDPEEPDEYVNDQLLPYVKHSFTLDGTLIVALQYPVHLTDEINVLIKTITGVRYSEPNPCRKMEELPNDPYFLSKSSWKQNYDDQWAIKRVGFTADKDSPWTLKGASSNVNVAVIDTGLDWSHKDISWENIWKNEREVPENGMDDDKNGYTDDVIGWDFFERTPLPWDHNGHGTFVTGVIAASQSNKAGIAGINPRAKIMVLKALNAFGHTRASYLAEAITYAANKGARVINLSVGGPTLTRTEQMAVDYAYSKGSVVVVAAGNDATDVSDVSPAGLKNVITVAATDINDKRAAYSNWGAAVDLTAPGNDVLSLRARQTDLMRDVTGIRYTAGEAYVGVDKRYYRASGTSFSTPIVAGTASLIFSMRPELTNQEVERMLLHSAKDVDVPGVDQHSGFGILNARAALTADPTFFVTADITGVKVVTEGSETKVQVLGSANADRFKNGILEIGAGSRPTEWKKVPQEITRPIQNGVLGSIAASQFSSSAEWTIRLTSIHQTGKTREVWFNLKLQ